MREEQRHRDIKEDVLRVAKGKKGTLGQECMVRAGGEWKAPGQTHLGYWFIGGYSLRDGCRIDQMEGYPYSQRQAVCQYPSLETQNGSKDPWHSPTLQRQELARLEDSPCEEGLCWTNERLYSILNKGQGQCLFSIWTKVESDYFFLVWKDVVLLDLDVSIC